MKKIFTFFFVFLLTVASSSFSQTYKVTGNVKNAETMESISNAIVSLTPGTDKTATDQNGDFTFSNISKGKYVVKVNFVGYQIYTSEIEVTGDLVLSIGLKAGGLTTETIEINRARDRETPVAFSDIDKTKIDAKISGQDAPLLARGIPGFYTYSTDGVGNGEGQLLVRGFSQNYVQVLINGIPTNDPESNSVYWSNWGAVSSNAGSIQIQRGAGSSLYGAGSFGGSFNILTENPAVTRFYGANLTMGDPLNAMYGVKLSSGLIKGKFAGSLSVDRKIAEGTRVSGRYEGLNYYTSLSYLFSAKQSVKFVLHGAPQEHGYSHSSDVVYFKKFGYGANPAPFVPVRVAEILNPNKTTGAPNYGLFDGARELKDDKFINVSHNFFHKPQAEMHYTFDINEKSLLKTTIFYSMGRGAGSSITGPSTTSLNPSSSTVSLFKLYRPNFGNNGTSFDTLKFNKLGPDGYMNDTSAANLYFNAASQRISYSFHRQYGLLASFQSQIGKYLKGTIGAEYRSWRADHPGHFTNLFNKTSTTTTYGAVDTANKVVSFSRNVYQGDLGGPTSDIGNIFNWDLSQSDPAYRTQYRNYVGETPQYTVFAQGNFVYDKFNFMGSLQYVWYQYKLTENMPSENAIGKQLTTAQVASMNLQNEGPGADGNFYMKGTNNKWYQFGLVNQERSRGFLQPKFGINYNATKNFNVFANFAHVERFVDLGIYYNQGRVNPNVEDEKSNQYEFGLGWTDESFAAKLNAYWMTWDNKSARIQDISQAGQPGYDRNGFRSELVGSSEHKGIEFEFNYKLDKLIPIKGFSLNGSFTYMDNKWKEVLASVKTEIVSGVTKNRVFNASARNSFGNIDTLYFHQLEGTPLVSGPQMMFNAGLKYSYESFFAGIDANLYARDYLLDGGTYTATDSKFINTTSLGYEVYQSTYDNQLPARTIFDFYAGYDFTFSKWLKGTMTLQTFNIFNTEYFASSDRFGLIPGATRSFRVNVSLGL